MAAPAKVGSGSPGYRNSRHRFRYLGDKRVYPVMTKGGKMIGYINGEAVVDINGREVPFKKIGELR
jgi:hypothetical protein